MRACTTAVVLFLGWCAGMGGAWAEEPSFEGLVATDSADPGALARQLLDLVRAHFPDGRVDIDTGRHEPVPGTIEVPATPELVKVFPGASEDEHIVLVPVRLSYEGRTFPAARLSVDVRGHGVTAARVPMSLATGDPAGPDEPCGYFHRLTPQQAGAAAGGPVAPPAPGGTLAERCLRHLAALFADGQASYDMGRDGRADVSLELPGNADGVQAFAGAAQGTCVAVVPVTLVHAHKRHATAVSCSFEAWRLVEARVPMNVATNEPQQPGRPATWFNYLTPRSTSRRP